ncbi:lectin C-type domain protein [Cooperia oncophora]
MRLTPLLFILTVSAVLFVSDAALMRCRCRMASKTTTTTEAPEEQWDPQRDGMVSAAVAPSSRKKCCCRGDSQRSERTTKAATITTSRSASNVIRNSSTNPSVDDHDDTQWDLPLDSRPISACPDGWLQLKDSCYHMESRKMERESAQKACDEKGATLFVADSEEEFKEIASLSPLHQRSWIGLTQYDGTNSPLWIGSAGMEPSKIRWLTSPFSSTSNGWSKVATCAAFYNTENYSDTAYAYFYPCSSLYHSICERNLTLANFRWLTSPFSSTSNGWSKVATCAAFYNTENYSDTAYAYFYPCSSLYHSICERNLTLANL